MGVAVPEVFIRWDLCDQLEQQHAKCVYIGSKIVHMVACHLRTQRHGALGGAKRAGFEATSFPTEVRKIHEFCLVLIVHQNSGDANVSVNVQKTICG